MTAVSTATAPATPRQPAHRIRARPGWDPVQFSASASERPEEPPEDTPEGPRLVWSNGRSRRPPDPQTWSGTVARACVEALRGNRPAAQLSRWLDPEVWTALSRRAVLAARMRTGPAPRQAVRVRRVHPCQVKPGVWETAVVLHDGTRVRAAAIRLEERRGHWRATAVQIG